jgi:hypothetical protein
MARGQEGGSKLFELRPGLDRETEVHVGHLLRFKAKPVTEQDR